MKKILFTLTAMLCFTGIHAQNYTVRPQKASMDDYIALLNFAKYEAFSFDISSLADSTRTIDFILQECEHGKVKSESPLIRFNNRTMLSDFREEDRQRVIAEGKAYDIEKDVYSISKKIVIGFTPIHKDSLQTALVSMDEKFTMQCNMKIRPVYNPKENTTTYMEYSAKPYKTGKVVYGQFIPLVMYGSFWYDKDYNIFRFCGNDPEQGKTSDIEELSPHYYVIGVKIHR